MKHLKMLVLTGVTVLTSILAVNGLLLFTADSGVSVKGDNNEVRIINSIPREGSDSLDLTEFCENADIISSHFEMEISGTRYRVTLGAEELNWPDSSGNRYAMFYWLEEGEQRSAQVLVDDSAAQCIRG